MNPQEQTRGTIVDEIVDEVGESMYDAAVGLAETRRLRALMRRVESTQGTQLDAARARLQRQRMKSRAIADRDRLFRQQTKRTEDQPKKTASFDLKAVNERNRRAISELGLEMYRDALRRQTKYSKQLKGNLSREQRERVQREKDRADKDVDDYKKKLKAQLN